MLQTQHAANADELEEITSFEHNAFEAEQRPFDRHRGQFCSLPVECESLAAFVYTDRRNTGRRR